MAVEFPKGVAPVQPENKNLKILKRGKEGKEEDRVPKPFSTSSSIHPLPPIFVGVGRRERRERDGGRPDSPGVPPGSSLPS